MNETVPSILALIGGVLLGCVFFGGLWWTVRKGVVARQPALWFLASFVVRTGIVLAGFYAISFGHWNRLLFCLAGFVVARIVLIKFLVPALERRLILGKERSHAP